MKKGHVILIIILFLISVTAAFYFFDYIDFPDLKKLPYYAASSFLRMSLAYFFSLCFALSYGYIAATNKKARKFMLPFLDILQSVPILGFFPAAVLFFIGLIHGRPGVEVAAIFLIFTSMAWNMAFGVYESLTTIPKELVEAADSFGLHGWQRLESLTLPVCVPKMVYNSIVSWSVGWFFLVASEIISAGSESYKLPGLGSFLIDTTYSGKIALMLVGLSTLIIIILLLEVFIWKPMQSWADKYSYEYAGEKKPGGFIFSTKIIKHSFRFIFEVFSKITVTMYIIFHKHKWIKIISKSLGYVILISVLAYISYVLIVSINKILLNLPAEAYSIPLAIVYSFLRLSVAYVICIIWTIPAAYYIAKSKKASSYLMPFMEVVASIPAIALFPALVVIFIRFGNLDFAAIILILTGMQWYILFNLIAGVKSIPKELENAATAFGIKGKLYWRKVIIPAMFPSFVTGSITAWGGGWNTLIVAEYIVYKGQEYHLFGIGYLLDKATFETPDSSMVILSVLGMSVTIIFLNRLIWQPLYRKALAKYKFD
ncbi:MAG: ABC transporter permease subunit [Candidatus Methanoperedens sp.]|nr:ABC transporter permease subunit [Candidatus Methanoperedens sp.]MCZ7395429.1 ABC transporter permease subunit [Candidatus Methanoperedens sp.]